MRAIFLTHYFPPEVGAAQTRIAALAAGLAARGIEVTVHTAPPHYPAGRIDPPYRNRPLHRERSGGVRVVRSAVYPAANRGFARRIANHASLGASALLTAPATGPADVVVVESPPLFTAAAGVAYAAAKRAALVINVSDRWPESAVELGALTDRRAIAAAEALERACYRRAARITVPTRGLVKALDAVSEARGKVVHVPPAVDPARFATAEPATRDGAGPLRVLYAGTVGLAQGLATLVEAAAQAGPAEVEVTIAGDGAELPEIRERARTLGAHHVRLLGRLPAHEIPPLYARADAGAVLLRDRPVFAAAVPTKLLEVMAAGRPVVLAARGEAADLVERTQAGVVVAPEDPGALAQALTDLRADPERAHAMGQAGRAAAADFAQSLAVDRWLSLLGDVAAERSPRPAGRRRSAPAP